MTGAFIELTIANLDCMDPDELEQTAGDAMAVQRTVSQVLDYVRYKKAAMRYRLEGDIVAAQLFEQRCDETYEELPVSVRW